MHLLDRAAPSTGSRRVLMVAFQFPPFAMSSGVQRTLRFVQHLPRLGWQPLVLSAHPRAYAATSPDLLTQIAPETVVHRAFALDSARHLAIAGRYPGFLARPDRWRAWALGAIPAGLRLIRRHRPDVIWSTYPIATAHWIALELQRRSGLPLVADFRDPMAQEGYPEDPRIWEAYSRIERDVVDVAARTVWVTPSAREMYRARYPSTPANRFALIENGYDEESFEVAERGLRRHPLNENVLTLLHSGIVYPAERDPRALFDALGRLLRSGRVSASRLRLRFRAPVHVELLRKLADQSGTSEMIEILPPVTYSEALQEMMRADGLLVMQGRNCNEQIPAKLYEYLRAQRPILGLADPEGDTAWMLRAAGIADIAALEDSFQVEMALSNFMDALSRNAVALPRLSDSSRAARAKALADLLEEVRREHAGAPN
jgi:glycosyltransferase involved in cell wall biosynthesis